MFSATLCHNNRNITRLACHNQACIVSALQGTIIQQFDYQAWFISLEIVTALRLDLGKVRSVTGTATFSATLCLNNRNIIQCMLAATTRPLVDFRNNIAPENKRKSLSRIGWLILVRWCLDDMLICYWLIG